jgi:hypothetical protein
MRIQFPITATGAEGELASAVLGEGHGGWLDQLEVVAVPQIGLDDPPPADQLAILRGAPAPPRSALAPAPDCRRARYRFRPSRMSPDGRITPRGIVVSDPMDPTRTILIDDRYLCC